MEEQKLKHLFYIVEDRYGGIYTWSDYYNTMDDAILDLLSIIDLKGFTIILEEQSDTYYSLHLANFTGKEVMCFTIYRLNHKGYKRW